MKTIAGFWGNIKLTTAVAALVLTSITITILAFSGSGYFDMRRQSITQAMEQQSANLQVAGTILEKRLSGSVLTWGDNGEIAAFQAYSLPFFHDTRSH